MAQKGWTNLQKSRKPCQALLIAAGVGIVRSVCVSCQRMLIELKNFWFSQTDFQPLVCTATPWGMRIFLDPIPINFFLFPLIYWCFHLLAQTSGGRMCPWCTMAFTAALSLCRHPDNNSTFESLFLACGNTVFAWNLPKNRKTPQKMKAKLVRWLHFTTPGTCHKMPISRRWGRCWDVIRHSYRYLWFFLPWLMS